MQYESLEQRMAQTYLDMFPPFIPEVDTTVGSHEQRLFYDMVYSIYTLAYEEASLFVPSLHEDDVYPNRYNKSSYAKPHLQVEMKKFCRSVDSLFENMYLIGQGQSVKLSRRQSEVVSRLGMEDAFREPSDAWVWMANRPEIDIYAFSHCFFRTDYPYTSDIYAKSFGQTAFMNLEAQLRELGYIRYDIPMTVAGYAYLSLTYINSTWSKTKPSGGFLFKVEYTGISVMYDPYVENPAVIGLCIPNKLIVPLLQSFESMNDTLKEFITEKTTKCTGCGYCTQTDKTKRRPPACIPVSFRNQEYKLCPRFPGFAYQWTKIDDELTKKIVEMLKYMDSFLSKLT